MGIIAAMLAGATFAFLRFNFHPASIFMGDAGSMLLGFVLASISVQSVMKGSAAVALVLPLLVLAVPFVDLFLIVWRRWRSGVPFYSPARTTCTTTSCWYTASRSARACCCSTSGVCC